MGGYPRVGILAGEPASCRFDGGPHLLHESFLSGVHPRGGEFAASPNRQLRPDCGQQTGIESGTQGKGPWPGQPAGNELGGKRQHLGAAQLKQALNAQPAGRTEQKPNLPQAAIDDLADPLPGQTIATANPVQRKGFLGKPPKSFDEAIPVPGRERRQTRVQRPNCPGGLQSRRVLRQRVFARRRAPQDRLEFPEAPFAAVSALEEIAHLDAVQVTQLADAQLAQRAPKPGRKQNVVGVQLGSNRRD